jgi:hypothetical protein
MKETKVEWAIPLVLALFLSCVPPCRGQEVRFPIPAYEGEELAAVREWERTWVGKEVDYTNVDQVADMLPKGYVRICKNPEEWHMERYWFTIVPYRQIIPSKGLIEATKKHAPIAREKGFAGKDNDELVTFETEAGFPFPDPKTGLEVAWNLHFQNEGDSRRYVMKGAVVTPKTGHERYTYGEWWHLWFAARTERGPKPALPKKQNKRNFRRCYIQHLLEPAEAANNRFMAIRYNDHTTPDDSYLWMSQFRRIRRYVATQKMDTIDGTDHCYEDEPAFNNHIQVQTYKLLGRKDMLVVRHGNVGEWVHKEGEVFWNGLERERVKTYVVEAIPKDTSHFYSKRVWYVDPEFFLITLAERYDRLGKYWRTQQFMYNPEKSELGETPIFCCGQDQNDQERVHGVHTWNAVKGMTSAISPKLFTLSGLRKGSY